MIRTKCVIELHAMTGRRVTGKIDEFVLKTTASENDVDIIPDNSK